MMKTKRKNNKSANKGVIAIVLIFVFVLSGVGGYVGKYFYDKYKDSQGPTKIIIEETPIKIDSVRPVGKIYVCSAIITDAVVETKEESFLLLKKRKHSRVYSMTTKCSYVVDLDSVKYEADNKNKKLTVTMPKLTYTTTGVQDSQLISDDDKYWAGQNINGLIKKVQKKIRTNFDTPQNREKANLYAEDVVRSVFENMGYEVVFNRTLTNKKE
ncbi:MAG: DUF4230 domain-containing protein [Bacteroidaceae bacterium]|nr:DUF4230 domain-containing protein [Bacteroidaceae bacterium]